MKPNVVCLVRIDFNDEGVADVCHVASSVEKAEAYAHGLYSTIAEDISVFIGEYPIDGDIEKVAWTYVFSPEEYERMIEEANHSATLAEELDFEDDGKDVVASSFDDFVVDNESK